MTTGSRTAGFRIPLSFQGKAGLILPDRIRTLDKSRLVKRIGAVHAATLEKSEKGPGSRLLSDVEQCLLSRFPVANPAQAIVFTNPAASAGWSGR